jgi:hypothetical protein
MSRACEFEKAILAPHCDRIVNECERGKRGYDGGIEGMSKPSVRGWTRVLGLTVVLSGAIGAIAVFVLSPSGEATAARVCNPTNRLGYVSKEPCEICVSGEGCFNAIPTVERAQAAAASCDLAGAISTMEEAVDIINRVCVICCRRSRAAEGSLL